MIRLIVLLLLLAALSLGAGWLADHPGSVTIYWLDWRIDTSFAFLAAAALAAALGFWLIIGMASRLIRAPQTYMRWRNSRNYAKGLQAITEGVAALVISDVPLAVEHTKKAQNYLGSQPITLLMQAQIARLKGEDDRMMDLLESMLNHPETEFLAARSLAEHTLKSRSASRALPYAEQAFRIQPADGQALVSLVGILLRLNRFDDAFTALQKGMRQRAIGRGEQKRLAALVHYQQSVKLLEASDIGLALASARQAWRRERNFIPFVTLMARTYAKSGDEEAAYQLMRQTWKTHPHPELAEFFFEVHRETPPDMLIKKAEKLAAVRKTHTLSHLLVAQANANAKRWQAARRAAKESLSMRESAAAMMLMAEIENGEYGDFDAAHQWMTKAAEAPAQHRWRCKSCETPAAVWQPLCPSCGTVDGLVMQAPYDRSGAEPEPVFSFVDEPVKPMKDD